MSDHSVKLSETQRAKLEGHRLAWGLRTPAEAIRHLIEHKADEPFSDTDMRSIMRGIGVRT